jgi:hypothetical protein
VMASVLVVCVAIIAAVIIESWVDLLRGSS